MNSRRVRGAPVGARWVAAAVWAGAAVVGVWAARGPVVDESERWQQPWPRTAPGGRR